MRVWHCRGLPGGCHHLLSPLRATPYPYGHPAPTGRRRNLLRAPRNLPRPRTPPPLPRTEARRAHAQLRRRRTPRAAQGQRQTKATVVDKLRELRSELDHSIRLRQLQRTGGSPGLAGQRARRPLRQDDQDKPERPRAHPDSHRRSEAPLTHRRRRAAWHYPRWPPATPPQQ
jgi:hypothetical protein